MIRNQLRERCEFICRVGRDESKSLDGKRDWQQNKINREKGVVAPCMAKVVAAKNFNNNNWEIA